MSIKFEVGKEYVTRSGEVVTCTSVAEDYAPYSVCVVVKKDGMSFHVTKDGSFFACGETAMSDIIAEHHHVEPAPTDEAQIKHMVERFLNWKLPENFNPDGGISFEPVGNKGTPHEYQREPVGTNLFDYTQAEAMVRHMLEGLGEVDSQPPADETKTLRDEYAMAALPGLLAFPGSQSSNWEKFAEDAIAIADAMMKARTQK